jgi:nucleoid DNA-binding protein
MFKISFSDSCEKIERSLEELVKIYKDGGIKMNEEERKYCQNTIKAIEEALKRESKVKLEGL